MRSRELPSVMKQWVDTFLNHTPIQALVASRTSKRLVVLAYHDIADMESFRVHAQYLRTHASVLSLEAFLEVIRGEDSLSQNTVLITFDDADRTIYERARPVLQEFGLSAVAFVVAGHLDGDRPFWWREVELLIDKGARAEGVSGDAAEAVRTLKRIPDRERRRRVRALRRSVSLRPRTEHLKRGELVELQRAGIAIGNHTMTHPVLDRCTDRRLRSEVVRSHEALTRALGQEPKAFAFPNGNYDPRTRQLLEDLGYECAFVFDHRVSDAPPEDVYRISRVRVNSTTPLSRLRILVSGLHPALHHAIRRS